MIVIQKKSIIYVSMMNFFYFNYIVKSWVFVVSTLITLGNVKDRCFGVAHGEHRIGSLLMQTANSLNLTFNFIYFPSLSHCWWKFFNGSGFFFLIGNGNVFCTVYSIFRLFSSELLCHSTLCIFFIVGKWILLVIGN